MGPVARSSRALQVPSEHEVLLQRRDARAADAQALGDLCGLEGVQAEPTRRETLSSTRSLGRALRETRATGSRALRGSIARFFMGFCCKIFMD